MVQELKIAIRICISPLEVELKEAFERKTRSFIG